jgi:hypothetical protein
MEREETVVEERDKVEVWLLEKKLFSPFNLMMNLEPVGQIDVHTEAKETVE